MIESYILQCNFERQFTESNGYEVIFHLRKKKGKKKEWFGAYIHLHSTPSVISFLRLQNIPVAFFSGRYMCSEVFSI